MAITTRVAGIAGDKKRGMTLRELHALIHEASDVLPLEAQVRVVVNMRGGIKQLEIIAE